MYVPCFFCAGANQSIIHTPESQCPKWWGLPKRRHRLGHEPAAGCSPDSTGEAQTEISHENWHACGEALCCYWGIRKMDWEEQEGLWDGFAGGSFRVQGSAWQEGLWWQVTCDTERKGWETSISNFCRVKTMGSENACCCSLLRGFEQRRKRKVVSKVFSHTCDGSCLYITLEGHLQRLWWSVVSLGVKQKGRSRGYLAPGCVQHRGDGCAASLQKFQPHLQLWGLTVRELLLKVAKF